MSRSYRKRPVIKETNTGRYSAKFGKQAANKTIRRKKEMLCHGSYKKAYCSWCICDYKFRLTQSEFQREWELEVSPFYSYLHRHFKSYKEALYWYQKNYRNK